MSFFPRLFRLSKYSSRVFKFFLPEDIDSFSTNETPTLGTWIDGKTIYRKVLTFAVGPEEGNIQIPHGLGPNEGFTLVKPITGVIYVPDGFVQLPLPYVQLAPTFAIQVELVADVVALTTVAGGGQYSTYQGHVILEYVKNT